MHWQKPSVTPLRSKHAKQYWNGNQSDGPKRKYDSPWLGSKAVPRELEDLES